MPWFLTLLPAFGAFLLAGLFAGAAGSASILGHLLQTRDSGAVPSRLTITRSWPVLFLAMIYLWMFLAR